ncbi:MAG: phosphoribosylamine--glycine ligase [Tissierellia bacterium]|nr:phosphoribosylamine--glycine ligase [Tissierellia bacterium]
MKILLIGSGGRESAIAWKLEQSERVEKIYVAPGLGGVAGKVENIGIGVSAFDELLDFSKKENIDLVVVGPELPLVWGIRDKFEKEGIKVFGPRKREAALEGSKKFAKEFMDKYDIPTAKYETFTDAVKAKEFARTLRFPLVIKADGLCAGKGVIIAKDEEEALRAIDGILVHQLFGEEGKEIVIEEFLQGIEASLLCFASNNKLYPMESAKDYKRIFDGDEGPNTGGVGCYSPSQLFTDELKDIIEKDVLNKIEKGLEGEGMDFTGILFIGFMIDGNSPKVLEFNVRFGDPETEVILPRLKSDLADLFVKAVDGNLNKEDFQWEDIETVAVILTSAGYPGSYKKGEEIKGIDSLSDDIIVFYNGTLDRDGKLFTNGGRVLTLVAKAKTREEARAIIYKEIPRVNFNGMQYRGDIGK